MFINEEDKIIKLLNYFSNTEFYQKFYYLKKEAELTKSEYIYYYYENNDNKFLIPLLKKKIDTNNKKDEYDLSSPYGYSGYLVNTFNSEFINEALKNFVNLAQSEKYISSFLRLNPYFNNIIFNENNLISHCVHGSVIGVNLTSNYLDNFKKYSSNHKRDIKKMQKLGFEVVKGSKEDIDAFINIYNETMDRIGATDYYYFDKNYYINLFDNDNENIELIFVKDQGGEYCSTAIFIKSKSIIQYHLGATLSSYLKYSPIKLIFDDVIKRFSSSSFILNLGGGLGANEDSLFKFKNGFSSEKRKFTTLRIIHNNEKYIELCSLFSKVEKRDLTNFFPLYRKIKF